MAKISILIVEDERIAAEDMRMSLENLGYTVCAIVSSGSSALGRAKELAPDLVLMDIKLHGEMNGIEAADLIRTRFGIPVVYITAYADKKTLEKVKKTEPYGFIIKPFENNELQGVIETVLYKHQMEKKLKESEERFRSLYENATIGLYRTTPEGQIVIANPALVKLLGYSSFEELAKRDLEKEGFEPGYSRDEFKSLIEEKGEVKGLELGLKKRDGTIIFVRESAKVFKDARGNVLYYEGTVEDITERKKAEKALKESEEKFRRLAERSPDVIFMTNKIGEITYISSAVEKMSGFKRNDCIGRHFKIFLPLIEIPKAVKRFAGDIRKKRDTEGLQLKIKRKDGSTIEAELSATPITRDGKIIGTQGIIRDITRRKLVEKALQESEEQYRTLFEKSPASITLLDSFGVVVDCNKSTEKLIGYKKNEIIGKLFEKLMTLDPKDLPKLREKYKNLLKGIHGKPYELEIIRKDRERRWISIINSLLVKDDKIIGFQIIANDITERKRIEELTKKDLKEKVVLLKEINHRVKNNMQVISSMLSLQSRYIKDKHSLELFKESQDRVRSMALVHEKLYQSPDLARVDFAEYIRKLVSGLYRSYGMNQDEVMLNIKVKDVTVAAGLAIPCGLIINELVSNTLKHAFPPSFKGKGKLEISLHPVNKKEIELTVMDNGIGIPSELDFRKTKSLGLQLVCILAEGQLEGKIKLDRRQGTKFQIVFEKG